MIYKLFVETKLNASVKGFVITYPMTMTWTLEIREGGGEAHFK